MAHRTWIMYVHHPATRSQQIHAVADPSITQLEKGRAGLRGWALIEDWMTSLDKGMVTDFNEDINTLLTFVSLYQFSSFI